METPPFYMESWGIYLAAASGLMLVFWMMTKPFPKDVRKILCAVMACLLYTPWFSLEGESLLAPAFMVVMFEGLSSGMEGALRGAFPILASILIVLVLLTVIHLTFGSRRPAPQRNVRQQRRTPRL